MGWFARSVIATPWTRQGQGTASIVTQSSHSQSALVTSHCYRPRHIQPVLFLGSATGTRHVHINHERLVSLIIHSSLALSLSSSYSLLLNLTQLSFSVLLQVLLLLFFLFIFLSYSVLLPESQSQSYSLTLFLSYSLTVFTLSLLLLFLVPYRYSYIYSYFQSYNVQQPNNQAPNMGAIYKYTHTHFLTVHDICECCSFIYMYLKTISTNNYIFTYYKNKYVYIPENIVIQCKCNDIYI